MSHGELTCRCPGCVTDLRVRLAAAEERAETLKAKVLAFSERLSDEHREALLKLLEEGT